MSILSGTEVTASLPIQRMKVISLHEVPLIGCGRATTSDSTSKKVLHAYLLHIKSGSSGTKLRISRPRYGAGGSTEGGAQRSFLTEGFSQETSV